MISLAPKQNFIAAVRLDVVDNLGDCATTDTPGKLVEEGAAILRPLVIVAALASCRARSLVPSGAFDLTHTLGVGSHQIAAATDTGTFHRHHAIPIPRSECRPA
jgi:hypothetical protein